MIYSFEFEECVLAAYNTEPVECAVHGPLELRELAPDAVSILSGTEMFHYFIYSVMFSFVGKIELTKVTWLPMCGFIAKARSKRRSTHVPNLTGELSTAEERRLNQFGPAVLIRFGKQR